MLFKYLNNTTSCLCSVIQKLAGLNNFSVFPSNAGSFGQEELGSEDNVVVLLLRGGRDVINFNRRG